MNKLTIIIKKKQKIQLTKEEGWHSEAELVELGWSKQGAHFNSTNHKSFTTVLSSVSLHRKPNVYISIAWYLGTVSKGPRRSAERGGNLSLGSGPREFKKIHVLN